VGGGELEVCFHRAAGVSGSEHGDERTAYRFWLLAHTVQNLSLKLSSGTMFCSACASGTSGTSLAPSIPMGCGSIGGGGGGGGTGDAAGCCCLARSRGSADMVSGSVKKARYRLLRDASQSSADSSRTLVRVLQAF
jgi:hypothetical protein